MIRYTAQTISGLVFRPDLAEQMAEDIRWSEDCASPSVAADFALEAAFVICNSGMRATVARKIYDEVQLALWDGRSAGSCFGHKAKAAAIDDVWARRHAHYANFMELLTDEERLEYLGALPWIGPITKYHLAKNFGLNVAKPDRHLQRLADLHGEDCQALCARLAAETGYMLRTIDLIIWRACERGVINSNTGEIRP